MSKPKRQCRVAMPVARLIDGRWCWLAFGTTEYRHEPAMEQILLSGCRAADLGTPAPPVEMQLTMELR